MAATQMTLTDLSNHTTSTVVDPSAWSAGNATDGNLFPNGGTTLIGMNNSGGSSRTVSIAYANTVDGQTVPARSYTIAAGVVRYVPLGSVALFGTNTLVTPSHAEVKLGGYNVA